MINVLNRRTPIGLDIGGHSVKAVQSLRTRNGWKTVAAACFPRRKPDAEVGAAELSEVKEILRRQGFVGSDVVIAAAQEKLRTGTLELPARGRGVPMEQIARAEFARVHKCDVGASEFCWWELPTPARAGKATQVMAVALPHADAEQQLAPFDEAGLRVTGMDTPTSTLARAIRGSTGGTGTVAALDLGWRGATIVVVRNGVVAYERRIAGGGLSKLHAALSSRFGADGDAGGQLIEEFGLEGNAAEAPVAAEARAMLLSHLGGIVEDVLKTCGYAQRQDPDAPIQLLFLAGGGARVAGIVEHFQSVLGFEVRPAQAPPSARLRWGETGGTTPSHAVAAALATFLS